MKKEDMKSGCLYKAYPASLTPYGAKINDRNSYDQAYGHYVLVTVDDPKSEHNGEQWMIDTYLIRPGGSNIESKIAYMANYNTLTWQALMNVIYSCYYRSACKLTDSSAQRFEKICDLNEVRMMSCSEHGKYRKEDCFYRIHVGREVGFSWSFGDCGVDLIKKDAKPDPVLTAEQLAKDMAEDSLIKTYHSTWHIKEFEKHIFEHRNNPEVVKIYEKYRERISETLDFDEHHRQYQPEEQLSLFEYEDD